MDLFPEIYTKSVPNSSTQLVGVRRDRYRILIYPPDTGTLYVRWGGAVTTTTGIPILAGSPPLNLCRDDIGDKIEADWFGILSVAGPANV